MSHPIRKVIQCWRFSNEECNLKLILGFAACDNIQFPNALTELLKNELSASQRTC